MLLIHRKTFLEVFTDIWINLTSGWFGLIIVVPGFSGIHSISDYMKLLTFNLPLAIVGLLFSLWLTEKRKKYES